MFCFMAREGWAAGTSGQAGRLVSSGPLLPVDHRAQRSLRQEEQGEGPFWPGQPFIPSCSPISRLVGQFKPNSGELFPLPMGLQHR